MKTERTGFKIVTTSNEYGDLYTIFFADVIGGSRPATDVEATLWERLVATGVVADIAREWLEAADEYTKHREGPADLRAEYQLKYTAGREAFRRALAELEQL